MPNKIYSEHFTDKHEFDITSATEELKTIIFYDLLNISDHPLRRELFKQFYDELYSYGEITPELIQYSIEKFKREHHV